MSEPYYAAYEKRYQAVYSAGVKRWGHSHDDEVLYNTLKHWVELILWTVFCLKVCRIAGKKLTVFLF